ncbi:82526372-94e5-463a-8168-91ecb0bc5f6b [Sclerotinia trifoliorum]|uniref:82526372-94e5-463a-8168-91ecb0bc5f6b n=1 Tax=Sclerotinia trifoliorum TaxID=28548 RepID=A0A8H2VRL3_9HELO|nr:82526372-94e5-463a-8168-91ecb0bc5f6b [Sclerotinia trifoliorum]
MPPRKNALLASSKEQEFAQDFSITVGSHVFYIYKDIAINSSKVFSKVWQDHPSAKRINFQLEDYDDDEDDTNLESFYTVDAMAHLIGYMYGNDLGCPTSDLDRHTGCLVAWCKVYKLASYFGMPSECESSLDRFRKCLNDRKYHPVIPTAEEVIAIYHSTGKDSEIREVLVSAMMKMWRSFRVMIDNSGGLSKDTLEDWRRSLVAVPEFEKSVRKKVGKEEIDRLERDELGSDE